MASGSESTSTTAESTNSGPSHGKFFSSVVRRYLGIETEKRSSSALEIDRLHRLLQRHGIDPDED